MKFSSFLTCVATFVATTEAEYEADCYLPLDVMFLQDTTGSFDEDLPNVVKQIPQMLQDIRQRHPNSFFGVAEFHDKPFYPLGIESDFCYKLGSGLTNSTADFKWAYSGLYASGGSDLPEASYHALINILEDTEVGWRPLATSDSSSSDPSVAGARVVIMSTDAVPHLPNDYLTLYDHTLYPSLPEYLPPYSGSPYPLQNNDIDWQCTAEDYPSPDQVRAVFWKHAAYLVILTPEDPAIIGAWQWVNEALFGQSSGFYQYIKPDSSNILDGVLEALKAVTATACASTTIEPTTTVSVTTTPVPTTTVPVTTTPVPTTTVPVTTTPVPTTTVPVTTTPVPTTTVPVTTTPAPTTTVPVTTTPVPTTTVPVTTTPVPTTTEAVTTTPVPTTTEAVTTTPVPTTTEAVNTTTETEKPSTTPIDLESSDFTREPEAGETLRTFPSHGTTSLLSSPSSVPATSTLLQSDSMTPAPSDSVSPTLITVESPTLVVDDSTSAKDSNADDCCPHVEIKMMKSPKQWKMLVVN